ncbi:DUF7010 family protein [Alkalicoccus urumqiensis]|uniref:Uncharacterized protein n=1 Tax=Alkalicoccus urumqiensis TaxID=1548213 RepID=A0A2P6MLU6_ALKUR|nr:hypothetical protein [Alkalicoccus urumqiensis]PRO67265.1 hypothetical protein C6I21_01515 [Alkalicoccus urumqiensis]
MSNVEQWRLELSLRGKNGIAFLSAGAVIWTVITVLHFLPLSLFQQNTGVLFTTGIMFPLSLVFSALYQADWKLEGHPLAALGLYLNLAQLMYFPLLFWAFSEAPEQVVLFLAVITSAHFYPYGWFYNSRAYYVMAPAGAVGVMLVYAASGGADWTIPAVMVVLLMVLLLWNRQLYQRRRKSVSRETTG